MLTLFDYLETNAQAILAGDEAMRAYAVLRCSAIKGRVVSLDEREMTGLRARLNLGHTLGHALENALEYTGILHGEAVAIGTSFAAHLAERVGSISGEERRRQIDLLKTYGLPTSAPTGVDLSDIRAALAVDKKVSAGQTRWILCDGIGRGQPGCVMMSLPMCPMLFWARFWRGNWRRIRHSNLPSTPRVLIVANGEQGRGPDGRAGRFLRSGRKVRAPWAGCWVTPRRIAE